MRQIGYNHVDVQVARPETATRPTLGERLGRALAVLVMGCVAVVVVSATAVVVAWAWRTVFGGG